MIRIKASLLAALSMSCAASFAASPYISDVLEFCPAPGQFVNDIPTYEEGTGPDGILSEARLQLCGEARPGMVSLGMFGGYVTFAFDHPLVNVEGEYDLKIYGNAFREGSGASAEPGVVWVSVDANGNGLPDDTWYQLAGSEYNSPGTVKNCRITYYRPSSEPSGEEKQYVRWTTTDPANAEGWLRHNMFHRQSYWPGWCDEETLSFEGTLLPRNAVQNGAAWDLRPFAWGYVDNLPDDECPGFKLDWAVDGEGHSVSLRQVDFIRVQSAEIQYCGALGETSTEVTGAEDLHPDAKAESCVEAAEALPTTYRVYSVEGLLLGEGLLSPGEKVKKPARSGICIVEAGGRRWKVM